MSIILFVVTSLSLFGGSGSNQIERQGHREYLREARSESRYFKRLDRHEARELERLIKAEQEAEAFLGTEIQVSVEGEYYDSVLDAACSVEPGVQGTFWFCVCPTGENNTCTATDYLAAKAKKDKFLGKDWCLSNSCDKHCIAETECAGEGDKARRKDTSGACGQNEGETIFACCWRMTGCTREGDCVCQDVGVGN